MGEIYITSKDKTLSIFMIGPNANSVEDLQEAENSYVKEEAELRAQLLDMIIGNPYAAVILRKMAAVIANSNILDPQSRLRLKEYLYNTDDEECERRDAEELINSYFDVVWKISRVSLLLDEDNINRVKEQLNENKNE